MIHIIIMFKTTVHSIGGVVRKSVSSNFPDRWCCPEKCPQQVPRSVMLSGKVPPAGSQTRFCCPEKCLHQNPEKSRKGVNSLECPYGTGTGFDEYGNTNSKLEKYFPINETALLLRFHAVT